MTRFRGWNNKAINKLLLKQTTDEAEIAISLKRKRTQARKTLQPGIKHDTELNSGLVRALNDKSHSYDKLSKICKALDILKIKYVRELQFAKHLKRRYRFDIAFPKIKLAVEYEGGIYTGGRHTRSKGYSNDAKKYNLAEKLDWKLLRYTTADTTVKMWEFKIAGEIESEIKRLTCQRKKK